MSKSKSKPQINVRTTPALAAAIEAYRTRLAVAGVYVSTTSAVTALVVRGLEAVGNE